MDTERNGSPETPETPKKMARVRWYRRFLDALADSANVRYACEQAGICRATYYRYRNNDPVFAEAADEATEQAVDALELEARRRGSEGVNVPVVYQGKLCGLWVNAQGEQVPEGAEGATFIPLTVKEYSDTLLIFLLKAHRPDKYRERKDVNHKYGGTITVTVEQVVAAKKKAEEWERERFGISGPN